MIEESGITCEWRSKGTRSAHDTARTQVVAAHKAHAALAAHETAAQGLVRHDTARRVVAAREAHVALAAHIKRSIHVAPQEKRRGNACAAWVTRRYDAYMCDALARV